MNRPLSSQTFASPGKGQRLQKDADPKENIWSSLLDSVASGKRLPEKTVLVLGTQSAFTVPCNARLTSMQEGHRKLRRSFSRL
jgi:hypothetical protein